MVSSATTQLPASAYQAGTVPAYSKPDSVVSKDPPGKIDPPLALRLQRAAAAVAMATQEEVVVTFVETQNVPALPALLDNEPRTSPNNQAALNATHQLVANIQSARAPEYAKKSAELRAKFGAQTTGDFWLINGMTMTLPLSAINALAARADVQYVESNNKNIPPPVNNSVDVRNLLSTDPYFSQMSAFIGILDTGTRSTHTLLSHVFFKLDCVTGAGTDCSGGTDPTDNFWNHGTSTASELSANNNLGNNNRGISQMDVDSYKIYNNIGLVTAAAVRGFQAALDFGDRVIVAEIQDTGSSTGSISTAADAAFDANAIVVAAAGNNGPGSGSVTSPGNARKSLAIGAADVTTLALQSYSGRAPPPTAAPNRISWGRRT